MRMTAIGIAAAMGSLWASGAAAQFHHGPATCASGFVWREAYGGDVVCVAPETRAQAAADNQAAPYRIQPGGGPYGPFQCMSGYVWREAVPGDLVCVTPEIREQTRLDNSLAPHRLAAPR